ncbi:MAG TPA: hypothetical protein VJW55_17140, partial [Candidatus Angelobacter sp.]|nr:hypothetical protein [Candidatus Angelobacter sp.]
RPGIAFEQDGRNFRPDGEEVLEAPVAIEAPPALRAPSPGGESEHKTVTPTMQEKRGPGRPKKALSGPTALASQFAGYEAPIEWDRPVAAPSGQDVLADYRGSGASGPAIFVDGV